ncbi:MAG TPA: hypothetical protein PLL78_04745 [Fimbriimonadaceae bacterium]|nr:hypothetical protein [Fimbriimonadaceae bacterium]HRJ95971.1 hypothetical protein [Fimbriimonadaceae bacterium]
MKSTLRLTLICAAALATLCAHALVGRITGLQVYRGSTPNDNINLLRYADNNFFRINSMPGQEFDFVVPGNGLGNPSRVRRLDVSILGSRTGSGPIALWMYDWVAARWTYMTTVELPTIGLGTFTYRVTPVPQRFVSYQGTFGLKFRTRTVSTMIVDRIGVVSGE